MTEPHVYLVQLVLPLDDNEGRPLPASHYEALRSEPTAQFGGLTAYSRSPAKGLVKGGERSSQRDEIVVYEVMAETLDRTWWADFRS